MAFDVVVAHDIDRGIGINGQLPWHCPADIAYFRRLTIGDGHQAVIMGRQTWLSIPDAFRPLPNRRNIVLSRTCTSLPGADVAESLNHALDMANDAHRVFVIGGAQVYADALAHSGCRTLFVTKLFRQHACDAYFPDYHHRMVCTYASNVWVHANGNCAFFQYQARS